MKNLKICEIKIKDLVFFKKLSNESFNVNFNFVFIRLRMCSMVKKEGENMLILGYDL